MTRIQRLRSALLLSAVATATGAGAQTVTMPTGGTVAAGAATIHHDAAATAIHQTSQRAIIDWHSFSIGAGGKVDILQPNAGAALLNRVTGGDISKIAGSLTANGQVFLINRNGIAVTPTGRIVAAGGFVGSTLDIRNEDFMAGRLGFAGSGTGAIVNQGHIAGGAVALLGGRIANDGVIVASVGTVALGSGSQATLDLNGDGVLQVAIPADVSDVDGLPLLSNNGLIEAGGGTVVMRAATAKEIVRQAVNMAGVIRATRVSAEGGTVFLDGGPAGRVTVSGEIDVSGTDGGRIDVSGRDVALTGATLKAAGTTGQGGLVRVGGAFQGGQATSTTTVELAGKFAGRAGPLPAIASAETTSLDAASAIDVSGATTGGSAVLWSTAKTVQAGTITATGGDGTASGGAIEVSSLGRLSATLGALGAGRGGTVLLDPKNIVVDTGLFPPNPGEDQILIRDVRAQIEAGSDVVLRASNDLLWNGDISIDPTLLTPGTINLSAGRTVTLSGEIQLAQANLRATANDSVANGIVDADREPGGASIDALGANIYGTRGAGTGGNVTLIVGTGAGLTNNSVDYSRFQHIEGRNVTIDSGSQRMAFFPSVGSGSSTDAMSLIASNQLTLSGAIQINSTGGMAFQGHSINWTTENSTPIYSYSFGVPVTFTENGVLTRSGVLSQRNNARLALGAGGSAPQYSATYGAAYPAFQALHVVSGSLQPGDTLASIVTSGSTTIAGPAAGQPGGDYAVVTTAQPGFAFTSGTTGYFADLRTGRDTLRITQNMLRPTVIAGLYTYGSPTPVVTLAGLLGSDTVNLTASVTGLSGTQTLTPSGGGWAFSSTIGAGARSFTLAGLTGGQSANYTLDLSGTITASLTINPKALTFTGSTIQRTYGTTASPSFLLGGIINNDVVEASGVTTTSTGGGAVTLGERTPVGTYTLRPTTLTGSGAANYVLGTANNLDGTLQITPKPLTYTATAATSTYGTAATVATPTLTGILVGDDVGASLLLNGLAQTPAARTAAGTYTITPGLTGTAAGNYSVAATGNTTASLTIDRLALGYSVTSASQVYGTGASVVTLGGVLAGDQVMPDIRVDGMGGSAEPVDGGYGFPLAGAGVHDINLAGIFGDSAGNYRLGTAGIRTATLTVSPKPITYSIADISSTYGNAPRTPTAIFSGTINALVEAPVVVTDPSRPTVDYPLHTRTPAGTYRLSVAPGTLTGVNARNYVIATTGNTDGTLTIAPRPITYIAPNASTTYGDTTDRLPAPTLQGVLDNDFVFAGYDLHAGDAAVALGARTPAGTYRLGVAQLYGPGGGNYTIAATGNRDGILTVAPRLLSYTVGSSASTYGTMATPFIYLNGMLPGDEVSGIPYVANRPLTALTDSGEYQFSVGALSGPAAGNYTVDATSGTSARLYIAPKQLSVSIGSGTTAYGEPFLAFANPVITGLVEGGDAAPRIDQSLLFPFYTNGVVSAGTYRINATVGPSRNYIVGFRELGDYTVTRLPVTVYATPPAAGGRIAYGATAAGLSASAEIFGVRPGDEVLATLLAPGLTYSTGGYINAGTYTVRVDRLYGQAGGNYEITNNVPAQFTVVPRAIRPVGGLTGSSTYGTVPVLPGVGTAMHDVARGDQVSVGAVMIGNSNGVATLGTRTPAGTYGINATALAGADAANYELGLNFVGSYTINPKPISYATANVASVYGTAALTPQVTLTGVVAGDQVVPVVPLPERTNVGVYDVGVSGFTGPAGGNYVVASAGNSPGKWTISPRLLTATLTSPGRITYGEILDPLAVVTLGGVLSGDSVAATPWAQVTGLAAGNGSYRIGQYLPVGAATYAPYLPAGSFRLTLAASDSANEAILTGPSARNYILPANRAGLGAALTVAPRPIGYAVTLPTADVYGGAPALSASFTGLVAGLTPDYQFVRNGTTPIGRVANLDAYTPAGFHSISVALNGADAFNYSMTGAAAQIRLNPRVVRLAQSATTATYGTRFDDLVTVSGLLPNDDVAPLISSRGITDRMIATANGFGIAQIVDDVTQGQAFSVSALTGSRAANYVIGNGTLIGSFGIAPKPITYTVGNFSAQYGGYSVPTTPLAAMNARDTLLAMGAVSLNGVLPQDAGFITPMSSLIRDGRGVTYERTTPAGTYQQQVTSLIGSRASNYVLATSGNNPGTATIIPAYLEVKVSDGARIYNGVASNSYQIVGTPGLISYVRAGTPSPSPALIGTDNIDVVLQLQDRNDRPVTASILPVGTYRYVPVGLTGQGAGNYQIMPFDTSAFADQPGSRKGVLTVADVGVFNFAFLSSNPNATVYTPPAATVIPPTPSSHTFQGSASNAAGTASASGNVDFTATGMVARGEAQAGVSTSTRVGDATITAGVGTDASGMAQVGVTGIYIGGTANAGATVTVSSGPGSVSATAGASASGAFTVDPTSQEIMIDAQVRAGTTVTGGAQGHLGSGVSGGVNSTTSAFAQARSNTTIGLREVGVSQFVGAGVSTGVNAGLSGGGVAGSMGVTLYSPGSLYIGARSVSDVVDGNFTLTMTIGIAIGIGGIELQPSITFPTGPIVDTATNVYNAWAAVFSGNTSTVRTATVCDAACADAKHSVMMQEKARIAYDLGTGGGRPTLDMMAYLQANPDVVAWAQSNEGGRTQFGHVINNAQTRYSQLTFFLNNVIEQEQAIQRKLQTDPRSITPDDVARAVSLRQQEEELSSMVKQVGGKLKVADGKILMVKY